MWILKSLSNKKLLGTGKKAENSTHKWTEGNQSIKMDAEIKEIKLI